MKICQTSTNGGTDGHSHGQIRPWEAANGGYDIPLAEFSRKSSNLGKSRSFGRYCEVFYLWKAQNMAYLPCRP